VFRVAEQADQSEMFTSVQAQAVEKVKGQDAKKKKVDECVSKQKRIG
jgi:hypothetical protein